MNTFSFTIGKTTLCALPSGGLWWAEERVLCVSDLHLGKSDRIARREGRMLPPYETRATLEKLQTDIDQTDPRHVICLGDSFDDLAVLDAMTEDDKLTILRLQAGRRWTWIEGNHDAGPVDLGGEHLEELRVGGLLFRHIAQPAIDLPEDLVEVSGHYHPKFGVATGPMRPAFIYDGRRVILPAYGAYTGGLRADSPVLASHFSGRRMAVLTGRRCLAVPLGDRI